MPTSAVALVLLAALLHASWNALLRVSGDRLVVMALLIGSAGAAAACMLPFAPFPARAAWPYLAASTVLHGGYNLFLATAYGYGGLGQVYPIARGSAPLLVLVLAWLALGERIGSVQVVAVLVTSLGIAALAFRGGSAARLSPRGLFFALGTAAFIGAYTTVDAAGARAAGSPHGYALTLFVCDGSTAVTYVLWRRRDTLVATARREWRGALLGGLMSLGSYWLVIWALTIAPAATVA
ncbi:MAG TPA: EamA family transporter, partial [Gemmataceae bacterium]|nr:EamA family transporter [Gemmataceae bacterium]